MDYKSARFAGDPLLEQILNDPDSGDVKLGPGSPADSVRPVQQALVDLGWPFRVDPPILADPFADGDFGTKTTNTVLRYKHQYDIHFPPTAPTGLIDGFVGPRTMSRLDGHIAFFDESAIAIDAKIAALQAAGVSVAPDPVGGEVDTIVLGHFTVMRFVVVDGAQGAIFNTHDIGAFEVHGNLFAAYMPRQDALGMPTSDEHDGPPGTRESDFELGVLRCDLATGAVEQVGFVGDSPPSF
jgi:hypothetical protein